MEDIINSLSSYLKKEFGEKTIKLAIDGGFTCPNRDGSKGNGGCAFCSADGSGDFASDIDTQIELLKGKWKNAKYLAYFQNHTNTYAPLEVLRDKYYSMLQNPLISGIVIGTRPDCIDKSIAELLSEIQSSHFIWVELGLQSIHAKTQKEMNLCYDTEDYANATRILTEYNIKFATHVILGLPGETVDDMKETVQFVCEQGSWGIKLHMLNVVRGSGLEKTHSKYNSFSDIQSYVELVCDLLETIPPEIVIHRLTADAPRKTLITPPWSFNKRTILNSIYHEMKRRNSVQGCKDM